MIYPIYIYGSPVLRNECEEIGRDFPDLTKLVEDMFETMYASDGVGLAAPQIGENLRVFVIDVSSNNEPLCPLVFINPKSIKKSGAVI